MKDVIEFMRSVVIVTGTQPTSLGELSSGKEAFFVKCVLWGKINLIYFHMKIWARVGLKSMCLEQNYTVYRSINPAGAREGRWQCRMTVEEGSCCCEATVKWGKEVGDG